MKFLFESCPTYTENLLWMNKFCSKSILISLILFLSYLSCPTNTFSYMLLLFLWLLDILGLK